MPRKLRRAKQRAVVTLDDLDLSRLLDFLVGWHPPLSEFERGRSRWSTWEEFDSEYIILRDEILAHEWTQADQARGKPIFAEERYQVEHQKGE